jgi:deoxyribose-phosphate aldolase
MYLEYCCYNKNLIDDVEQEIKNCFNAISMGFLGLSLPLHVLRQISSELLLIPDICISCPVDYPLGCGDRKVREHEALVACKSGATAIDLVMNPYLFNKGNESSIKKDISPIVELCAEYYSELRIIINYHLYEQKESLDICELLRELGVTTIIPSTGFHNDDIFDNLLFCNLVEKKIGLSAISSGRMWLDKHLKAALNSGISGVRVYSLKNLFDLGVDS